MKWAKVNHYWRAMTPEIVLHLYISSNRNRLMELQVRFTNKTQTPQYSFNIGKKFFYF